MVAETSAFVERFLQQRIDRKNLQFEISSQTNCQSNKAVLNRSTEILNRSTESFCTCSDAEKSTSQDVVKTASDRGGKEMNKLSNIEDRLEICDAEESDNESDQKPNEYDENESIVPETDSSMLGEDDVTNEEGEPKFPIITDIPSTIDQSNISSPDSCDSPILFDNYNSDKELETDTLAKNKDSDSVESSSESLSFDIKTSANNQERTINTEALKKDPSADSFARPASTEPHAKEVAPKYIDRPLITQFFTSSEDSETDDEVNDAISKRKVIEYLAQIINESSDESEITEDLTCHEAMNNEDSTSSNEERVTEELRSTSHKSENRTSIDTIRGGISKEKGKEDRMIENDHTSENECGEKVCVRQGLPGGRKKSSEDTTSPPLTGKKVCDNAMLSEQGIKKMITNDERCQSESTESERCQSESTESERCQSESTEGHNGVNSSLGNKKLDVTSFPGKDAINEGLMKEKRPCPSIEIDENRLNVDLNLTDKNPVIKNGSKKDSSDITTNMQAQANELMRIDTTRCKLLRVLYVRPEVSSINATANRRSSPDLGKGSGPLPSDKNIITIRGSVIRKIGNTSMIVAYPRNDGKNNEQNTRTPSDASNRSTQQNERSLSSTTQDKTEIADPGMKRGIVDDKQHNTEINNQKRLVQTNICNQDDTNDQSRTNVRVNQTDSSQRSLAAKNPNSSGRGCSNQSDGRVYKDQLKYNLRSRAIECNGGRLIKNEERFKSVPTSSTEGRKSESTTSKVSASKDELERSNANIAHDHCYFISNATLSKKRSSTSTVSHQVSKKQKTSSTNQPASAQLEAARLNENSTAQCTKPNDIVGVSKAPVMREDNTKQNKTTLFSRVLPPNAPSPPQACTSQSPESLIIPNSTSEDDRSFVRSPSSFDFRPNSEFSTQDWDSCSSLKKNRWSSTDESSEESRKELIINAVGKTMGKNENHPVQVIDEPSKDCSKTSCDEQTKCPHLTTKRKPLTLKKNAQFGLNSSVQSKDCSKTTCIGQTKCTGDPPGSSEQLTARKRPIKCKDLDSTSEAQISEVRNAEKPTPKTQDADVQITKIKDPEVSNFKSQTSEASNVEQSQTCEPSDLEPSQVSEGSMYVPSRTSETSSSELSKSSELSSSEEEEGETSEELTYEFETPDFEPSQTSETLSFEPSESSESSSFEPSEISETPDFEPSQTFETLSFKPSETSESSSFKPSGTSEELSYEFETSSFRPSETSEASSSDERETSSTPNFKGLSSEYNIVGKVKVQSRKSKRLMERAIKNRAKESFPLSKYDMPLFQRNISNKSDSRKRRMECRTAGNGANESFSLSEFDMLALIQESISKNSHCNKRRRLMESSSTTTTSKAFIEKGKNHGEKVEHLKRKCNLDAIVKLVEFKVRN